MLWWRWRFNRNTIAAQWWWCYSYCGAASNSVERRNLLRSNNHPVKKASMTAMVTVYWSSGGGVAATAQAKWQTRLSFAYVVKWLIEEAYNLLFQHTNFEGFHCTKMPKQRWQRWWMKRCCSCFLEHVCWVIIVWRLCNNHKKIIWWKSWNF